MNQQANDDRLIVFDCDGVLVDSEVIVVAQETRLLEEAGFPMTADEIIETCVGLTYPDMMAVLEKRFGKPVPEGLSKTIQADALAAFPDELKPVAGMQALLADLVDPRCVASSSNLDRIQLSLRVTNLEQHFEPERIFSAQMVTKGKPAPDLFLHAATQCGYKPEQCVVVEDSPHGVTAAVAAEMKVIGYVAALHARPWLAPRLEAAGANAIANNAEELSELLAA